MDCDGSSLPVQKMGWGNDISEDREDHKHV